MKLSASCWLLAFSCIFLSCSSVREQKEKATLHAQLGNSLFEQGNYPQALAELLQAEKFDSNNPQIQNNLGLVYWARQKYELAEKHLLKAINLDKGFTDARNNLARVYIEMKNYPAAEEQMNKVMADLTYGALDKAYYNLGVLKFSEKKYEESEEAFRKSIDAQRDNCYATSYLGRTYFEREMYEQASTIFDRAIGLCKKIFYDEPHYYSALSYFRLGQREKAEARFDEILRNYPDGKYLEKARAMLRLIRRKEI